MPRPARPPPRPGARRMTSGSRPRSTSRWGESQAEAEEKAAFIAGLARPIDTLALLSEALNYDFATKPPGEPFSDEEMALDQRPPGDPRPGGDAERQSAPHRRGLRHLQPARHGGRDAPLRRHAGGRRRPDGGTWFEGGALRRLRARRHAHAGRLRGCRAPRGARAAAARALPRGLCRPDAPGEPRPAALRRDGGQPSPSPSTTPVR